MTDLADLDSPGARFEWFVTDCYGGVPAYVERFDFNASQVYRTISNSSSPRLETCALYAATGINIHWMTTGEGQWWAPNDVGRELAKKKGIVISEGGQTEASAIDYTALVRAIFALAEESVLGRLDKQHEIIAQLRPPPKKTPSNRSKG